MKKKLIECYRCHKKSEKLYKLTIFKPEDFIETEVKMCKTCKEILHIIHGVSPKSLEEKLGLLRKYESKDKILQKLLPDWEKLVKKQKLENKT